jgi:predicted AlkP superfamily pyrophosphatase or phosphodiesterase
MLLAALLAAAAPLPQAAPPPAPNAPTPRPAPKLVVVISVDQFSADLFQQYRDKFTGGFARLLTGAVFPNGYQSHAATETCPGHSTILTGMRPAHTGIVANKWVDQQAGRPDTVVYCAEDERVPGSDSHHYTVSDRHLKVPTLGEYLKRADPASRVVSVAGKDRAAVMMGGHRIDELWWWDGATFRSYAGRPTPPVVADANRAVAAQIAQGQPPLALPGYCVARDRAIATAGGPTVGTGRFARTAGDKEAFLASPEVDGATLALAAALRGGMRLGQGTAPDLLIVGASATDYVGHAYGTEGTEMCLQLASLDRDLGDFFGVLDASGVDYEVVLTADHGGRDLPERQREQGLPQAVREVRALLAGNVGKELAARLHLAGPVLRAAENAGDVWLDTGVPAGRRPEVLAAAVARYAADPQVAAVFTRAQLAAAPPPTGVPTAWSLLDRARASFDADRSGDFVFLLKPMVMGAPTPQQGYVATHGSPWDWDRRVPMLFWRKGMTPFEQPAPVESVDIAPTLAGTLRLPMPPVDGRCLDLDAGAGSSCPG